MITRRPAWAFSHDGAQGSLTEFFETASLEGFGFTDQDAPLSCAAGAILD